MSANHPSRRPMDWKLAESCCQVVEHGVQCALVKAWVPGNLRLCVEHDAAALRQALLPLRGRESGKVFDLGDES